MLLGVVVRLARGLGVQLLVLLLLLMVLLLLLLLVLELLLVLQLGLVLGGGGELLLSTLHELLVLLLLLLQVLLVLLVLLLVHMLWHTAVGHHLLGHGRLSDGVGRARRGRTGLWPVARVHLLHGLLLLVLLVLLHPELVLLVVHLLLFRTHARLWRPHRGCVGARRVAPVHARRHSGRLPVRVRRRVHHAVLQAGGG